METINKLLKKPAPKRRTRAEMDAARAAALDGEDGDVEKPDPLYVRWVSNREGSRIGMPDEWLEGGLGEAFKHKRGFYERSPQSWEGQVGEQDSDEISLT